MQSRCAAVRCLYAAYTFPVRLPGTLKPRFESKGLTEREGNMRAVTRARHVVSYTQTRFSALALFLLLATGNGQAWLLQGPQVAGPSVDGSSRVVPSAWVRIEHQIVRKQSDSQGSTMRAEGSGTVVGPHTILTHGHYRLFRDPSYTLEAMVMTFHRSFASSIQMTWIDTPYADAGTSLLVLPDWMRLPEAATLGDPRQLRAGDAVTIAYWDPINGCLATVESTISMTDERTARVKDLGRVIKPGDSGGAVYNARGELIGNVWSIAISTLGRRLPWFEVALLPADIEQYIR